MKDNIPLDDIEAAFRGDTYTSAECSSMKLSAPPKGANPNTLFFVKHCFGFVLILEDVG